MNIIVCIKQVPDPEALQARFKKIGAAINNLTSLNGVPAVISIFDEIAVEAACRLKEKHGGKITVITMGQEKAIDVAKHAIAMGASEGILLRDKAFDDLDSFGTAFVLAKAIQKIDQFDVILCGRQAADWDQGQVGSMLAEILDIPVVTIARDIHLSDGKLRVDRALRDGYEVIEAPMPCLITISNEIGLPRLPTGMGIITAARKKIPVWTSQDIGIEQGQIAAAAGHTEILGLFVPVRESKCEIIAGENAREAGIKLALKMREFKLL